MSIGVIPETVLTDLLVNYNPKITKELIYNPINDFNRYYPINLIIYIR